MLLAQYNSSPAGSRLSFCIFVFVYFKCYWPNTIVHSLVSVCLSVFFSLFVSNAIGPIQWFNRWFPFVVLPFCICVFQMLFPLNTIVQLPVPIINLSMNLLFVIAKTV